MLLQITSGMFASGEPVELGIFLATYTSNLNMIMNNIKAQEAKKDLAERLAREFKSVKITPIPKEGDQDGIEKKNDS